MARVGKKDLPAVRFDENACQRLYRSCVTDNVTRTAPRSFVSKPRTNFTQFHSGALCGRSGSHRLPREYPESGNSGQACEGGRARGLDAFRRNSNGFAMIARERRLSA